MKTMRMWQFVVTHKHKYTELQGVVGDAIVTTTPLVKLDGRIALTKSGSVYRLEGPHAHGGAGDTEIAEATPRVQANHP